MHARIALVLLAFATVLAGLVWWNWSIFAEIGVSMPASGWIALGLGVFFTLVVGCGLMFLVFYSSRRGYDEAAARIDDGDAPSGPPDRGEDRA